MICSPLTQSDHVRLIQTFQTAEMIQAWQRIYQLDLATEFRGYPEFFLYECCDSDLRFFYPFDLEGSESVYQQLMGFDWYYLHEKWEYQLALKELKPGERILEIGSGQGQFVGQGIAQGLDIIGIELNPTAITQAQAKALPIFPATLQELGQQNYEFDCICCFQVLEHIAQPREFLQDCLALLAPNGRLILGLPNAESFLKDQFNLLDMPPHHMTRWSLRTCQFLETFLPLKLQAWEMEPLARYHVDTFLETYGEKFKQQRDFRRFGLNQYTTGLMGILLKRGLHRYFRGQSFYVRFQKLAN